MPNWALIARMIWFVARYLFLIVFSSIVGANLGLAVGLAIGELTGEPGWAAHGRCAGWTLFVLLAAFGAPLGFVRFHNFYKSTDNGRQKNRDEQTPPAENEPQPVEPERIEGGVKALLVAPLIGAFMGLILGGMAGGLLVALYFFAALSPLGPGGWWPILPLTFESFDNGFSTKDAFILVPWLVVVVAFVILGVFFGLFGTVSCGQKRYQVFRSKKC